VNCERVRPRLAEYTAGLIQGDERVEFGQHLASCPGCRADVEEYRALDELFVRERISAEESLVRNVMTEVRVMGAPPQPTWVLVAAQLGPLAAVAAALPLLALLVLSALAWSTSPSAASLFPGVPYGPGLATGIAVAVCGLAALFTAWLTWRAAESLD
jgi:anti-sigma factor RsiW